MALKPPPGRIPEAPAEVPVENLELDPSNPRLAINGGPRSQEDLLQFLWDEMAVDEVALSIAANGYFPEEPLFVIPKDARPFNHPQKRYIVVEGNRRLAAVLILRRQDLRTKLGAELPKLSAQSLKNLNLLPVSVYRSREDLWQYFGFRHINGPKPWDAYAKARYVAEVREQYGKTLDEIADSIGDRHTTVKRLYRGYKVLEQAETALGFSTDDRVRGRFFFSHLYTAADQPEFQRFLGIAADASLKPNPVPRKHLENLRSLMFWLYVSRREGKPPLVRTQNPDLNTLRRVIASKRGLAALHAGFTLERAREAALGDKYRFREALTRSREDLREAKATVTNGYSGDDELYEVIIEIVPVAESIRAEMEAEREGLPRRRRWCSRSRRRPPIQSL